MLYVIGGVTRSGKSYLTREMVRKHASSTHQISFFNMDNLMMGLLKGIPDIGCEGTSHAREKARAMWPVVKEVIKNAMYDDGITDKNETENPVDYIIDGVIITPAQFTELRDRFPDHIKACWIGYPNADRNQKYKDIQDHKDLPGDWLSHENEDRIYSVIDYGIQFSQELQQECAEHDIPFFDVSDNFTGALTKAEKYLLNRD